MSARIELANDTPNRYSNPSKKYCPKYRREETSDESQSCQKVRECNISCGKSKGRTGQGGKNNILPQQPLKENVPSGPAGSTKGDHTDQLPEEIHRIIDTVRITAGGDTDLPKVPTQAMSRVAFGCLSCQRGDLQEETLHRQG